MSEQRAIEFIKHAESSPAVQEKLAALTWRSAITGLVAIAAAEGFEFSEDDYRGAVVALAEGELDDESIREVQDELGLGHGD